MAWNFRQFQGFFFVLLGRTKYTISKHKKKQPSSFLLASKKKKILPFSCFTANMTRGNLDIQDRKTCYHSGHFPPE